MGSIQTILFKFIKIGLPSLFIIACLYSYSLASYADPASPTLVTDGESKNELPKRFRIMNQDGLQAIGSGQFTLAQLIHIKNKIKAPIIIVDLREESHGFADGLPISWYGEKNWANKNKKPFTIQSEEQKLLFTLTKKPAFSVRTIQSKDRLGNIKEWTSSVLKPREILSEQQLVSALELGYKRFYVTDHTAPSQLQVEEFKKFIKTVPQNTWLYFHCRGGSGRTTTFMVLYDSLKNAGRPSLAEIINRHHQSGGKNLMNFPEKSSYQYPLARERYHLIEKNYKLYKRKAAIRVAS